MSTSSWLSRRALMLSAGGLGLGAGFATARRTLVGTAGPMVAAEGLAALPQVPRRTLGRTGEAIPILALGGGGYHAAEAEPKYREALLFGANYYDTADCYPGCEAHLGAFLRETGSRADVWITTKSCAFDPEGLRRTLERSLERLQTTYVDALFLHALDDLEVLDDASVRACAEQLKEEGRIRYFGFSTHGPQTPELLLAAAARPWVDIVMFRYNFRTFGNQRLDAAIDAAYAAGIGLIAMKTQGSALSGGGRMDGPGVQGDWSRYQLALKAVWEDPRISAAVSMMDTTPKLRQNLAAALDTGLLSAADRYDLDAYALETRSFACDGCDHLCRAALEQDVAIGPIFRHLMYAESYGQVDRARRLYRALPPVLRSTHGRDLQRATEACPNGIDVAHFLKVAQRLLAEPEPTGNA